MLRSLLLITVVGCGGKQAAPQPISNTATEPAKPPPPPKTGQEIAREKMGEFRDAMCKCAEQDAECATAISDEMTRWAENQPRSTEPIQTEIDPEMERISKEMVECMAKAMLPKMGSGSP